MELDTSENFLSPTVHLTIRQAGLVATCLIIEQDLPVR